MTSLRDAMTLCALGLAALSLTACSGPNASEENVRAAASSTTPAATEAPPVDLAALIESIPGYTYAPAPAVEQAFGTDVEEGYDPAVIRAFLLEGEPQGNVIVQPKKTPLDEQDVRNSLAGAEAGGNEQGTASRVEVAGRPAVKTVRADGGTTYATVKGRYVVIVGARPEVAEDFTTQLLGLLPG
jgi:hypothetical protein